MKKEESFSVDFIVRKTKSDPAMGYLSVKITVNNAFTEISLKEKIPLEAWQAKGEKVKGKGKEQDALNLYINDVRYRVSESKRALESARYFLTAADIRDHYNNKHVSQRPDESGHSLTELTATTKIDSAFLKPDTTWKELVIKEILPQEAVKMRPMIKIKIEVDTKPPLGFDTEEKFLLRLFSFYVKCFSLPDLFAGKMHALLFRKWKGRVKGRDWYDMEWYIKKKVPLNLGHLLIRAKDTGDWKENAMTKDQFMMLLQNKIESVSFNGVREDIIRFIPDGQVTEIWPRKYFSDLAHKIN